MLDIICQKCHLLKCVYGTAIKIYSDKCSVSETNILYQKQIELVSETVHPKHCISVNTWLKGFCLRNYGLHKNKTLAVLQITVV